METTPRPPSAAPGGTRVLAFDTWARMRDRDFYPVGTVPVSFRYDPRHPYALTLLFRESGGEVADWTASRDAFLSAGLHGVPLPGLDLVVTQVVVTRAHPGGPDREVPTLRVALHESEAQTLPNGQEHITQTGQVSYFDFDLEGPLAEFLRRTTDVVPQGQEGRYLDIDAMVDYLLGRR